MRSAKSSVYNWKSTNPLTLLASYPKRHSQLAWSFFAWSSMHFVSGKQMRPSTTNAKYFACISAVGGTDPKAGRAKPKNATCPSGKTGTKICLYNLLGLDRRHLSLWCDTCTPLHDVFPAVRMIEHRK